MNILKKTLIGLGGLFVLLVVFIMFLGGKSSNFKDDYSPFAKTFLSDLSVDWDKSDVIDRMSNSLIEQSSSQEAQSAFQQFQSLGALKSFGSIEIENYTTHSEIGEEAVFTISTRYEAGHVLWRIGVNVKDKKAKITGLRLAAFDGEPLKAEQTVDVSA